MYSLLLNMLELFNFNVLFILYLKTGYIFILVLIPATELVSIGREEWNFTLF